MPTDGIWGIEGAAYLATLFLVPVLLGGTLLVGRALGGRAAGWLAVLLVAASPFTVYLSQLYQNEFAVMAMVAAFWGAWLHSDEMERPGPALAAGILAGLGLLAKFTFAFFSVVAVGVSLYRAGRRHGRTLLGLPEVLGLGAALGISFLAFSLFPDQGGPWRIVVGEAALALFLLDLFRRRHGDPAPRALLAAAALVMALAGPYYCGGPHLLHQRFEVWERWSQATSLAEVSMTREYLFLLEGMVPGAMLLLPLGLLAAWASPGARRPGTWVALQLAVGVAFLASFKLIEPRFLPGLLPLVAGIQAAWVGLWGRAGWLAPAALFAVLAHGFSPPHFEAIRSTKDPFAHPRDEIRIGSEHFDTFFNPFLREVGERWRTAATGPDLWIVAPTEDGLHAVIGSQVRFVDYLQAREGRPIQVVPLEAGVPGDPEAGPDVPRPPATGVLWALVVDRTPDELDRTVQRLERRFSAHPIPGEDGALPGGVGRLYLLRRLP